MNSQDLHYEVSDGSSSDFETLAIPSDEETRQRDQVAIMKPNQDAASRLSAEKKRGSKPKLPPKPPWTPSMDLSQVNCVGSEAKSLTLPARREVGTGPHKADKNRTLAHPNHNSATTDRESNALSSIATRLPGTGNQDNLVFSNNSPILLSNLASNRFSDLSNLKFGDDSLPNTPNSIHRYSTPVATTQEEASPDDTVPNYAVGGGKLVLDNSSGDLSPSNEEEQETIQSFNIDNVTDRSLRSLDESTPSADVLLTADEETAKEAARLRLESLDMSTRESKEDASSPTWPEHRKHVFILSSSGKPVYTRYGCEEKLVNLFGIMQALISIVEDNRDELKYLVAGKHKFVFTVKDHLMLVAVSQGPEYERQIFQQLMYAYNQILSVLTFTQLHAVFKRKPNFDLRFLLQGSEKFIDNILNLADTEPSYILGGVRCLPMSPTLRLAITSVLIQCKTKEVIFAVMVAANQLVTLVKPKEFSLQPVDIHIIMNLIDASTSFRSAESWTPICLPKFNNSGFLHAHVSYLTENSPACLMLLSNDREKFFTLQECRQRIVERLTETGCIQSIRQAVSNADYPITPDAAAIGVRHFIYKSRKTSCLTSPRLPVLYYSKAQKDRLFGLYMFMHHKMHNRMVPVKIFYHVGGTEALLGWRTDEFDLYLVFSPLVAKVQVIQAGNSLIKWIKSQEDRFILTSMPTS